MAHSKQYVRRFRLHTCIGVISGNNEIKEQATVRNWWMQEKKDGYIELFERIIPKRLQTEAIKYGVEHLRRNRGGCMGALYWQLNDCWSVASWASVDGYGRYKALHYEARRFFEPIHSFCAEIGEYTTRKDITGERYYDYETKAQIFVSNETMQDMEGSVEWKLCSADGKVLQTGGEKLMVKALSYASLQEMDFHKTDIRNNYLSCGW